MKILIYANRGAIFNQLIKKEYYDYSNNLELYFSNINKINTIIYLKGYSKANIIHYFVRKNLYNSNIDLPLSIYKCCDKYELKNFIYISTYKINYFSKYFDDKFISFILKIISPYSYSKYKAENKLLKLSLKMKCKLYIFRLPVVIGILPKGKLKILIKYYRVFNLIKFIFRNKYLYLISIKNFDELILDIDLNSNKLSKIENYFEKINLSKLIETIYMIKCNKIFLNSNLMSNNLFDDLRTTLKYN